jgi:hypothetical protein
MDLTERVSDAAGQVGLLLVLITLFTNEQARSRDAQANRSGGSDKDAVRRIRIITAVLAAATIVALLTLLPLVIEIAKTCCEMRISPTLALFVLTWLLLVGLVVWHVVIWRR